MEMSVTVEIPYEIIADSIKLALTSASTYWCSIIADKQTEPIAWKFGTPRPSGKYNLWDYPFNPGGAIKVIDMLEGGAYTIDEVGIEVALRRLAFSDPDLFGTILQGKNDFKAADSLLQLCCFSYQAYQKGIE